MPADQSTTVAQLEQPLSETIQDGAEDGKRRVTRVNLSEELRKHRASFRACRGAGTCQCYGLLMWSYLGGRRIFLRNAA